MQPNPAVIGYAREYHASGEFIVIITGRWQYLEAVTQSWLKFHKIPYHAMAMRFPKDYEQKSVTIKLAAYQSLLRSIMSVPLAKDILTRRGNGKSPNIWYDDDPEMLAAVEPLGVEGRLVA